MWTKNQNQLQRKKNQVPHSLEISPKFHSENIIWAQLKPIQTPSASKDSETPKNEPPKEPAPEVPKEASEAPKSQFSFLLFAYIRRSQGCNGSQTR